jgi:ribosomal protein S18 acetylase RimI-like enzyme
LKKPVTFSIAVHTAERAGPRDTRAMHIEHATSASDELVAAMARLIPQLSPAAKLPSHADLAAVVAQPGTFLLLARDPGIVGTLTLTLFRVPTGVRGFINNVVVDAAGRGRGVGEALTREAIRRAREAGAERLSLNSRSEREAANRLYRRLGFQVVVTNTYRLAP